MSYGFVAGAYSALYGGLDLGMVEDGFTMSYRYFAEQIRTDNVGDALNDNVYRGVQLNVRFILSEWNLAAVKAAFWPFSNVLGQMGDLGRLGSNLASPLVLTACDNSNTPASITFYKALLAPDFSVDHLFANKHRKVSMDMIVFPQAITNASTYGQCDELALFITT